MCDYYLQGILLVYDITNKWSFDGIDRWIKEIDEVSEAAFYCWLGQVFFMSWPSNTSLVRDSGNFRLGRPISLVFFKTVFYCTLYHFYFQCSHSFYFVFQHAPGVPKILVGNRCHLAYKRQVSEVDAEAYALKSDMAFFEVSPLCDFNVMESMAELSRVALKRNGMSRTWGPNKG